MKKVLVIGSGGREHALCWKLAQSANVGEIYCAPGNAGIARDATCISLDSEAAIIDFCKKETIDLVVIGPEQPLVEGLADALRKAGLVVFGPSAQAARLEGSKGFMKDLCKTYTIPTAAYGFFDNAHTAKDFLAGQSFPIVVKADGLAAGKGVIIAQNKAEAEQAIDDMFAGIIAGGSQVVIEEFLEGEELSFFALCDGKDAIEFGYAQDHKRAYDGDKGPNTGGMGTYSPPGIATDALRQEIMENIILPTVHAMATEDMPFSGVLFAGLMLTKKGVKLIEYNVRFGDPEIQSLMMRFDGDLYQTLEACAKGMLDDSYIRFSQKAACCVVMAANGYPGHYEKGSVIEGLDAADALPNVKIFHAGTAEKNGKIVANGGRVLGVTAQGNSVLDAQRNAYEAIEKINWPEGFYRHDIGWQGVA